ncbi:MAG: flagellar export protein FliJ, partial [Beijerinckiaceae bacterium]
FERMAHDLDREVANEERRAGISDPAHFAYPTYARAARTRRENIMGSVAEMKVQHDAAKAQLEIAFEELKKVEILQDREQAAERAEQERRDQMEMDRVGSRMRMRA